MRSTTRSLALIRVSQDMVAKVHVGWSLLVRPSIEMPELLAASGALPLLNVPKLDDLELKRIELRPS